MAAAASSVDSPQPLKTMESGSGSLMGATSSPLEISPSSDKLFWSALRRRVDDIVEDGRCGTRGEGDGSNRSKRLKEDSMLLLRGFDSIAHTLSQLSDNIDNALQGARDLAKPPTLTEIFQSKEEVKEQKEEENKKALKRKFDSTSSCSSDGQGDESESVEDDHKTPANAKLKKAKNVGLKLMSL